jgi:hypothetical protein
MQNRMNPKIRRLRTMLTGATDMSLHPKRLQCMQAVG